MLSESATICHYACRPSKRSYYYANSTFSSLAVFIASTQYAYPRRNGQAELAWMAGLNAKTVYPWTITHPSTKRARR